MAKKKKPQQQPLSPSKYIRLKGRTLPIAACYINRDWQQEGMANIIVARQHQSGNYTVGNYLVDTFCLGVKDAATQFSITPSDLDDVTDMLPNCTEITYNEVHNIIYGALTFAEEEADIAPHPDFELAQYLLEEDTDEIPLIEYEYGKDGKPFLAVRTRLEASKYLPKLQERYGAEFPFLIREEREDYDPYEEMDEYDDEEYDDEERDDEEENLFKDLSPTQVKQMLDALEKMKEKFDKSATLTQTTYAYVHPTYPDKLTLTHNELEVLYNKEHEYSLPRPVIEQLLALPRETLIADLNQIILCELGKSCDNITDDMFDNFPNTLTHALFLLGELRAAESLQTVLEILRQNDECIDYHFGDSRPEVISPTIYYIARHQTDQLLAFMQEPGLDSFARSYVLYAITSLAINEPERREEAIDWCRQLLRFLIAHVADSSVFDAKVAGSLVSELVDMHAAELLPEIKELYDTGQVDEMCCGSYASVEENILNETTSSDNPLNDIYERYQQYEKKWKR